MTGNKSIAVWKDEKTSVEQELYKQTKWSDGHLIEPLLFNFYHGIELLLKGFVQLKQKTVQDPNHSLTKYLDSFTREYPTEISLIAKFDKYLISKNMPDILQNFFKENSLTPDHFHVMLRYPYDKKDPTKSYQHDMLKYKGHEGVMFFEGLVTDISDIMRMCVALSRQHKPEK